MLYYVAVLLGCLIFLLLQLRKAYYKKNFSWPVYFRTVWLPGVINLVCGWVLVFSKADIQLIYPITFISAVVLGIAGQAVFKGIFEATTKINITVDALNEESDVK